MEESKDTHAAQKTWFDFLGEKIKADWPGYAYLIILAPADEVLSASYSTNLEPESFKAVAKNLYAYTCGKDFGKQRLVM